MVLEKHANRFFSVQHDQERTVLIHFRQTSPEPRAVLVGVSYDGRTVFSLIEKRLSTHSCI